MEGRDSSASRAAWTTSASGAFPPEGLAVQEPEIVEIDRRYVKGVARDRSQQRVFRRLVRVAESLSVTVIAEGLEKQGDVQALLDLGVRYAQGSLVGRPAPIGES